jgi:hypothetical protein
MFSTEADAMAYLSAIETDTRRGSWIDPRFGRISFAEYAQIWLTSRTDIRPRTVEQYHGRSPASSCRPSVAPNWPSSAQVRSGFGTAVRPALGQTPGHGQQRVPAPARHFTQARHGHCARPSGSSRRSPSRCTTLRVDGRQCTSAKIPRSGMATSPQGRGTGAHTVPRLASLPSDALRHERSDDGGAHGARWSLVTEGRVHVSTRDERPRQGACRRLGRLRCARRSGAIERTRGQEIAPIGGERWEHTFSHLVKCAPGRSRTRNLVGRSHPLCPVELRGQVVDATTSPRRQGTSDPVRAGGAGRRIVPCCVPHGGRSSVG